MDAIFDRPMKRLGFGFMRLPMNGDQVDIVQTNAMVDTYLQRGFCYFDTAHGYLDGKSELALKTCLTSRYPRDRYLLADKLSSLFFNSQEEIRPLVDKQLQACGVEYFDYYLMHAMSQARFPKYRQLQVPQTLAQLKQEGKIRHIGMSFHDKAQVLDEILSVCPEIEFVQIQFNYLDYDDEKVESYKCYQVCRKHHKPVFIMEPVKGGALVNLPAAGEKLLRRLSDDSNASYAIRFAAGFEGVAMVLSGMSSLEQVEDNTDFMADFQPLSQQEQQTLAKIRTIIRNQGLIGCTNCRYCTEVCPQAIPIPELFAAVNARQQGQPVPPVNLDFTCLQCGQCEDACPQKLNIRELLIVADMELD